MIYIFNIFILLMSSTLADTKIIVISDLNDSYGSMTYNSFVKRSVDYIASEKPDLVIATGDLVAGQKRGLNYQAMWDGFYKNVLKPINLMGIPFAVTPGNHDASGYFPFKLEREIYKNQAFWQGQKLEFIDDTHYPFYYAFSFKNILFISIDGTMTGALDRTQKSWVKKILKENRHFNTKIAFSHLPLFPVAKNRENDYIADEEFYQILKDENLTLYLSGHHHAYYPGTERGLKQISQACLGGGPRPLIGTSHRSSRSFTKINIKENGSFDFEALIPNQNFSKVNTKDLPETIKIHNFNIKRLDQ